MNFCIFHITSILTHVSMKCKDGDIGNATLYTLYFSVLIIENVICGPMVLAALIVGPCAFFHEVTWKDAKLEAQGRAA